MGNLYLISTPIGNLKDITLRAIETIKNTRYLLCEDTRHTGILLKNINENGKHVLISYYDQIEYKKIPYILELLKTNDVALISDAGTPLIADPGYKIVDVCVRNNIKVISIPGASAFITALLSSGQPVDNFWFLGYLPDSKNKKVTFFNKLFSLYGQINKFKKPTFIFYESPKRLAETLQIIKEELGDVRVTVARELTKIYEEVNTETVTEAISRYQDKNILGEITLLIRL